jgi:hypothetical protein
MFPAGLPTAAAAAATATAAAAADIEALQTNKIH